MNILDQTFAEVERKCKFSCASNYTDEEMIEIAEEYKKRIPLAKLKYNIRKILKICRSVFTGS